MIHLTKFNRKSRFQLGTAKNLSRSALAGGYQFTAVEITQSGNAVHSTVAEHKVRK